MTAVLSIAYIAVDNSLPYHSFRTAIETKSFILSEEAEYPSASWSNATFTAIAQVQTDRVEKIVSLLGDETADVLDIISARWLHESHCENDTVTLTADDFLKARGLQRQKSSTTGRRGGYKDEWRQKIADRIELLSSIHITLHNPKTGQTVEGPAVVVSTVKAGRYTWQVRPGSVFTQFPNGRQSALLSRRALEYNPYKQMWEKRLTRYLAHLWRIRQHKRNYGEGVSVKTLLSQIGLTVDAINPARTKRRFDLALENLEFQGVIQSSMYLNSDIDDDIVDIRGWVDLWLASKVSIQPPDEIAEYYRANIRRPAKFKQKSVAKR